MPTALVAATRNVYAVPLVSPVTVVLVAGGVPVTVLAGLRGRADVRGDRVAGDPLPPSAGAVQDTTADPSPAVAVDRRSVRPAPCGGATGPEVKTTSTQ